MATRRMTAGHSRLVAFVDDVLDEASLPIHLKREARADFIAHLEADAAVAMKAGLSEDEAIEAAIRSFGAISDVRHALRNAAAAAGPRGRHRFAIAADGLAHDLRDALRNLWTRRATSAIAVATLAIGIGITSA